LEGSGCPAAVLGLRLASNVKAQIPNAKSSPKAQCEMFWTLSPGRL
jgi:hypothetical protein